MDRNEPNADQAQLDRHNESPGFEPPSRQTSLYWRVGGVDRTGTPLFGWHGPHAYDFPYVYSGRARRSVEGFHLLTDAISAIKYGRRRCVRLGTPATHLYAMLVPEPYSRRVDRKFGSPIIATDIAAMAWRIPLTDGLGAMSEGDIAYKPNAFERWHESWIKTIPQMQWRYTGDRSVDSIREMYFDRLDSVGSGLSEREVAAYVAGQCAASDNDPERYVLRAEAKQEFLNAIDWWAVRRRAWLNVLKDDRRRIWEACPFDEIGEFEWGYAPRGRDTAIRTTSTVPEFTPLDSLDTRDWMDWVGVYGGVWDRIHRDGRTSLPDEVVVEAAYAAHEACRRLGVEPEKDLTDCAEFVEDIEFALSERGDEVWGELNIRSIQACFYPMLDALDDARPS